MLAALIDKPFDSPDWIFETKWDGYRAIAELEKGHVELYSRNGLSFNERYPPIVEDLKKLGLNAILDGEIVVIGKDKRASFQQIQNYQRDKEGKIIYYLFDLLYLEGYDLRQYPLMQRKELLQKAITKLKHVQYCNHIDSKGIRFFKKIENEGGEGIIAKRKDSPYREGRSRDWLKIKAHNQQEVIICGYTEPAGSRKYFGALILGIYKDGRLVYAGHTGTGFNQASLKELYEKMQPYIQKECEFKNKPKQIRHATWVKPSLVAEVKFTEWTDDGSMRHPVFQGLRIDKKSKEVKMETAEISPKVKLTHLNKVFWPDEGYTKGDLLEYYKNVSHLILPYLKERPESMLRFPNGINGSHFFQKEAGEHLPEWVKTFKVPHEEKNINYIIINDLDSLLYTINLGCIDLNPLNSRCQHLHHPDYLIIDLDPENIAFDKVIETAQEVRRFLEEIDVPCYCKTSGATGLHIYIPTNAKYTDEETTLFAQWIACQVNERIPEFTSIIRRPSRRQNKVYIDFLQNRFGATLAAPYSVRPKPQAPVSTPLKWSEVKKGLLPTKFTMRNALRRFEKVGDLFAPVLGKGIDLKKIIQKLKRPPNGDLFELS